MSSELPLWFGRERGTDLSALVEWEEEEAIEGGPLIDDFTAGLLGLVAPLSLLAIILAAASLPLLATIGVIGIGSAWLAAGIIACAMVGLSEEEPPAWATAFSQVLVAMGKVIAVISLIVVVIFVVAMVLGLLGALFSSDRR